MTSCLKEGIKIFKDHYEGVDTGNTLLFKHLYQVVNMTINNHESKCTEAEAKLLRECNEAIFTKRVLENDFERCYVSAQDPVPESLEPEIVRPVPTIQELSLANPPRRQGNITIKYTTNTTLTQYGSSLQFLGVRKVNNENILAFGLLSGYLKGASTISSPPQGLWGRSVAKAFYAPQNSLNASNIDANSATIQGAASWWAPVENSVLNLGSEQYLIFQKNETVYFLNQTLNQTGEVFNNTGEINLNAQGVKNITGISDSHLCSTIYCTFAGGKYLLFYTSSDTIKFLNVTSGLPASIELDSAPSISPISGFITSETGFEIIGRTEYIIYKGGDDYEYNFLVASTFFGNSERNITKVIGAYDYKKIGKYLVFSAEGKIVFLDEEQLTSVNTHDIARSLNTTIYKSVSAAANFTTPSFPNNFDSGNTSYFAFGIKEVRRNKPYNLEILKKEEVLLSTTLSINGSYINIKTSSTNIVRFLPFKDGEKTILGFSSHVGGSHSLQFLDFQKVLQGLPENKTIDLDQKGVTLTVGEVKFAFLFYSSEVVKLIYKICECNHVVALSSNLTSLYVIPVADILSQVSGANFDVSGSSYEITANSLGFTSIDLRISVYEESVDKHLLMLSEERGIGVPYKEFVVGIPFNCTVVDSVG